MEEYNKEKLEKLENIKKPENKNQKYQIKELYLKDYPELLKNINNPPKKIYYIGDISIIYRKCISIIGKRKASNKGIKIASDIAKNLNLKYVIVSGMAEGIDSAANNTASELTGKTVAVLGTAIDAIYPKKNIFLYNKIIENGGCIISEYEPGAITTRSCFVARNRIIAGLSEAIIVVESNEKSGTHTTVSYAAEEGRDVYAVIGEIDNENYYGNLVLIRDGAKAITNLESLKNI